MKRALAIARARSSELPELPSSHKIVERTGNSYHHQHPGHHASQDDEHPLPVPAQARDELLGRQGAHPLTQSLKHIGRRNYRLERSGKMRFERIDLIFGKFLSSFHSLDSGSLILRRIATVLYSLSKLML